MQRARSCLLNPIPRGLKYNLFHAGRGIYAPPRDFALAEPMMHQKLCHFIHIKFEQFVGHRKRKQHFKSKNVVVAVNKKFRHVKCADFWPFQNASSKVSKLFSVNLHPLNAKHNKYCYRRIKFGAIFLNPC